MCGFIFGWSRTQEIDYDETAEALQSISWRGPDVQKAEVLNDGKVFLGHCRLTILDLTSKANQPMVSTSGRYYILFNGEIYNHLDIRAELNTDFRTTSDTETILEGYELLGSKIFELLDGMFAVVIYDSKENKWIAARDAFGIKPLYISTIGDKTIISSEPATIAKLINANPSQESIEEWKLIRRPVPGSSYFEDVNEVLPGSVIDSCGNEFKHWQWSKSNESFDQLKFENILQRSIAAHELSDVRNISLLSGGIDSAIISCLSSIERCYTVGLIDNNEFEGAFDTASEIKRELIEVSIDSDELIEIWKKLTRLRGEPLSVPNEGLIFKVCNSVCKTEKVVLTGEGADELFFGYDGIFRWASRLEHIDIHEFLSRYGYSDTNVTARLEDYLNSLLKDKSPIEFVEDFFYQVHLPGLLRRMDFASMAASKEARVPFVSKALIQYVYRQPWEIKISGAESKIPLRILAEKLNLLGAVNRKKIGFSAITNREHSRVDSYKEFQNIILGELGW